ncbi:MAG: carboxylesterase family protein [Pseudomonadota bacterium]
MRTLFIIGFIVVAVGGGLFLMARPPAPDEPTGAASASVSGGALTGVAYPGYNVFRGVPYAKAARWSAPEPADGWAGALDASAFGDVCPQAPVDPEVRVRLGGSNAPSSEDCLNLNIWAPAKADGAAVMVWIHGGGNVQGASSLPFYDGRAFARSGVVFVSINYRLGPLGFFAHPLLTIEAAPDAPLGNYGLMDQIAALQWVQENVEAFGGDPAKVTVFGESAGGANILALLSTDAARGLFRHAIVQSGGGWSPTPSLAARERAGAAAASSVGLAEDAAVEDLRALPLDRLQGLLFYAGAGPMADGRFLTESPADAFAAGRAIDVPLIIGSNSGEDSLMDSLGIAPEAVLAAVPAEAMTAARAAYNPDNEQTFARDLYRDAVMGAPAEAIASAAAAGAPSYLYYFDRVPRLATLQTQRAPHGVEILFIFRTLDKSPVPVPALAPSDRATGRLMHGCWVSFAKTGEPDCPNSDDWPAYAAQGGETYVIGGKAEPVVGFHETEYAWHSPAFTRSLWAVRTRLDPE